MSTRDPFEWLRQRLARDDGVSEIIAYVFMFALGAVALTFSMEVLVDTQERGTDVAAATQLNQVGQVTATFIERAARVGLTASNATFNATFELPEVIGGHDYNVTFDVPSSTNGPSTPPCPTQPILRISNFDGTINTTIPLSNLTSLEVSSGTCLVLTGTFDSSSPSALVKYEAEPEPRIVLDHAVQVT